MFFILMRVIHVFCGVAWAGGAFMLVGFVTPAVQKSGPSGGRVMQMMAGPGRLSVYLTAVALLTTFSGIYLYWVHSGHFNLGWITSLAGIALTIGSLAGLAAAVHGGAVTGRLTSKMAALGQELQAIQGPPPPEKLAEMQKLQEKVALHGRISAILLLIAVGGMSVTGYL